jgi:4-amino-4-deoxy-L-arabinose transferase-like glycosyltransferase
LASGIASLHRPARCRLASAALLAVAAIVYLRGLGASPLLEPDEGRYASIPRSMLVRGDWVVPHLNGLPYVQKPPLGYWLTAIAYRASGVDERGARLAPALAALGTIALVAWFGTGVFGPAAGFAAAAMLATMPLFYLFGRLAILDMPLTFFVTLAVVFLYRGGEDGRWRWRLGAGVALGAALLTKGPVGVVLPLGVVAAAALVERDHRPLSRALAPCILAVLIALPWFWAVTARLPGFLEFFFVRHHLERYAVGGKIGHAHFPGFLVPVLLGGALPWSLVAIAALGREGRAAWRDPARRAERWCDLWVLVVLVFFSASRLQIATYVCPAFVPLALRAGCAWTRDRARWPLVAWTVGAAVVLGLAALPEAAYRPLVEGILYPRWWHEAETMRPLLLWASGAVLLGTAFGLVIRGPELAVGVAAGALALALGLVERARVAFPSYAAIGTIARVRHAEADRLVIHGRFLQGLPFYARRRVVLVGAPGPLDFGVGSRDGRMLLWDEARLVRAWNGRRRIFLVVRPKDWRGLRRRLRRPASVLALEHDRVLLSNVPLGQRAALLDAGRDLQRHRVDAEAPDGALPHRLGGGVEDEARIRRRREPGRGRKLGVELARRPAGVAEQ